MAHDLEPTLKGQVPSVPEGYYGDVPPWFQAPVLTERPEWTELRPPYHPESKLERHWSNALMVPRALALGFLWITYAWYRFGSFCGTLLLIYFVYASR